MSLSPFEYVNSRILKLTFYFFTDLSVDINLEIRKYIKFIKFNKEKICLKLFAKKSCFYVLSVENSIKPVNVPHLGLLELKTVHKSFAPSFVILTLLLI